MEKICEGCHKPIDEHGKVVYIQTLENKFVTAKEYFHFKCWKEFHKNVAKKVIGKAKQKAVDTMSGLTNSMQNLLKENSELGKKIGRGDIDDL